MHLYIDTTDKITIGLLSDSWQWIEYFNDPDIVISTKLHAFIYKFLEKHEMSLMDIKSFIYCAGPGSYTGMRVAEGIADLVKWEDIPITNFYHYEIPKMIGIQSGVWFANAFKGEKFLYTWNEDKETTELIKNEEFERKVSSFQNKYSFIHSEDGEVKNTLELIRSNAEQIFTKLSQQKSVKKLFYYRELEQEFTKC